MFTDTNEFIILALTILIFLTAIEGGFRLGRRYNDHDEATGIHFATLQNALLGLLALLISFTFVMSIARYDTRRALVVDEANAIGTSYLRAQYLEEPQKAEATQLLKDYVDARLGVYNAGTNNKRLKESRQKTNQIQEKLWAHVIAISRKSPDSVAAGLFTQSVNDVFDVREKQRAALENRVPGVVVALLFVVSGFGMGFVGYGYGLTTKRRFCSTGMFALLIAIVLVIVLDIDRPKRGLIQISDLSLQRLQDDFNKGDKPAP